MSSTPAPIFVPIIDIMAIKKNSLQFRLWLTPTVFIWKTSLRIRKAGPSAVQAYNEFEALNRDIIRAVHKHLRKARLDREAHKKEAGKKMLCSCGPCQDKRHTGWEEKTRRKVAALRYRISYAIVPHHRHSHLQGRRRSVH